MMIRRIHLTQHQVSLSIMEEGSLWTFDILLQLLCWSQFVTVLQWHIMVRDAECSAFEHI